MKTCEISQKCGGCSIHQIPYKEQLKEKTEYIKKLAQSELNNKIKIKDIIGMENPYNYRNKGKFVFGMSKQQPLMGFFEEGTHKVVNSNNCMIQNEEINEIANFTFELIKKYKIKIYNEDTGKGFLRYLIIKHAIHTDENMLVFVTTDEKLYKREEIIKALVSKFPNIKTIVQNINNQKTKVILGIKNYKLYGNGYIVDYIEDLKFKISPLSFYQVNPIQTEKLYNTAIQFANLTGKETVYDLYSGIGTISLLVSKQAKKVYGIEVVKDAVKDAIENARLNKISNVEFIDGKVEEMLPRLCQKEKADVVFVDPPRSGLDLKTIKTLESVKPNKIVYINCNPVTLMQNLKILQTLYTINEIQPVDMFPWTEHVECCSVLYLKDSIQ